MLNVMLFLAPVLFMLGVVNIELYRLYETFPLQRVAGYALAYVGLVLFVGVVIASNI